MSTRTSSGLLILLISLMLTAACMPGAKTGYQAPVIQRLVFRNDSDIPMKDVRIYINATRELVHCGYILPDSECSTGFPSREYQGNRFDVSWQEYQRAMLAQDILAKVPDELEPGQPVNAVLSFKGGGVFSARLVARDPARLID